MKSRKRSAHPSQATRLEPVIAASFFMASVQWSAATTFEQYAYREAAVVGSPSVSVVTTFSEAMEDEIRGLYRRLAAASGEEFVELRRRLDTLLTDEAARLRAEYERSRPFDPEAAERLKERVAALG